MFSIYVFSLLSLVEISASAEKQRISKISTSSAPNLDPSMPCALQEGGVSLGNHGGVTDKEEVQQRSRMHEASP